MAHVLTVRPTARPRRLPPVLAVVAVVALLALPLAPGGGGGAHPADVVSALVVLYSALRLLRDRRRPLSRTAAVVLGLPVLGLAVAAVGAASPGAGPAGLGRYLQVFVLVPAAVLLLLRDRGDVRLLVAGGETSGAVVSALRARTLAIGAPIAPGVAWARAEVCPSDTNHTVDLALKSGNFGGTDIFTQAWEQLV